MVLVVGGLARSRWQRMEPNVRTLLQLPILLNFMLQYSNRFHKLSMIHIPLDEIPESSLLFSLFITLCCVIESKYKVVVYTTT